MKECVDNLKHEEEKEKLGSSLWGAERCLRVLESVSVERGGLMSLCLSVWSIRPSKHFC